jgi:hypothetical protein
MPQQHQANLGSLDPFSVGSEIVLPFQSRGYGTPLALLATGFRYLLNSLPTPTVASLSHSLPCLPRRTRFTYIHYIYRPCAPNVILGQRVTVVEWLTIWLYHMRVTQKRNPTLAKFDYAVKILAGIFRRGVASSKNRTGVDL